MMKIAVFAFALIAMVAAAPQAPQEVQILKFDNEVHPEGYNFAFDTSDGTSRQERGELKNVGTENESLNVEGAYSFVAPDGQHYAVTFVADENGYRPQIHLTPAQ